jgi:hypothetical protein
MGYFTAKRCSNEAVSESGAKGAAPVSDDASLDLAARGCVRQGVVNGEMRFGMLRFWIGGVNCTFGNGIFLSSFWGVLILGMW